MQNQDIEDAKERMFENALAALTFAKQTLSGEPEAAGERVCPTMQGYSMEEIHVGALYALTVLMGYEAAMNQVPVEEHVESVRRIFLHSQLSGR